MGSVRVVMNALLEDPKDQVRIIMENIYVVTKSWKWLKWLPNLFLKTSRVGAPQLQEESCSID